MEADLEQRVTPMRPDRDRQPVMLRASSITSRENFDEWRTKMPSTSRDARLSAGFPFSRNAGSFRIAM
jgi:hypothetical protein